MQGWLGIRLTSLLCGTLSMERISPDLGGCVAMVSVPVGFDWLLVLLQERCAERRPSRRRCDKCWQKQFPASCALLLRQTPTSKLVCSRAPLMCSSSHPMHVDHLPAVSAVPNNAHFALLQPNEINFYSNDDCLLRSSIYSRGIPGTRPLPSPSGGLPDGLD